MPNPSGRILPMLATRIDVPPNEPALRIVNAHQRFPRVSLIDPSPLHFLHIAAEIDRRPPFLPSSRVKRRVAAHCKAQCAQLRKEPGVIDASAFTAIIIPPGLGEYAKRRADKL